MASALTCRIMAVRFVLLALLLLSGLCLLMPAIVHADTHVSGTINANTTWTKVGSPYILDGDVTVAAGVRLTLEPGVEVRMNQTRDKWSRDLIVNGTLVADGTAEAPIRIRNTDTSADYCSHGGTLSLTATSVNSVLDNVQLDRLGCAWDYVDAALRIASSSVTVTNSAITNSYQKGIYIDNNASPVIRDSQIAGHTGQGIYIVGDSSAPTITGNTVSGAGYGLETSGKSKPVVTGNSFSGSGGATIRLYGRAITNVRNNTLSYVYVEGDTLDASASWGLNGSAPYVMSSDLTVPQNVRLTLEPGVEVQLNKTRDKWSRDLIVNGTLIADGTAEAPIRIRNTDTSGDYCNHGGTLSLTATSVNSVLDNVQLDRLGCAWDYVDAALRIASSSVTVSNSAITNSYQKGIYIDNNASPRITGSDITGNPGYGVYNASSSVWVNARNNWWGDPTGPYHATLNPGGKGNKVSDRVYFDPWMRAAPGKAPEVVSAELDAIALPTNGDLSRGDRTAFLVMEVTDPDGLADLASVTIDLTPIGGTTVTLTPDGCSAVTPGRYCGYIRTTGSVTTGNKTLTITVTDKAGLAADFALGVTVIKPVADIWADLDTNPNLVLNKSFHVLVVPTDDHDWSLGTFDFATELKMAGTTRKAFKLSKQIIFGATVKDLLVAQLNPLSILLGFVMGDLPNMRWQTLRGAYPLDQEALMTAWQLPHPAPTPGQPYWAVAKVKEADWAGILPVGLITKSYYLELTSLTQHVPSSADPVYRLPDGYTFVATANLLEGVAMPGQQIYTVGQVSERWQCNGSTFVRLWANGPVVARITGLGSTLPPNVGTLVSVTGEWTRHGPTQVVCDLPGVELSYYLDFASVGVIDGRSSSLQGHESMTESGVVVTTGSPVDIHAYDAAGRHVGPLYDGQGNVTGYELGIDDVLPVYSAGDKLEGMVLPAGVYTFTMRGTDTGVYARGIRLYNTSGGLTYQEDAPAQPTQAGQADQYPLNVVPAAPTGLRLSTSSGGVTLDWADNQEADLAGYHVYRSEQPLGSYARLTEVRLSQSTFLDAAAGADQIYYYYVTAQNTRGVESGQLPPRANRSFIFLPLLLRGR